MPHSILRIRMWFFYSGVDHALPKQNWKLAFFCFFFCFLVRRIRPTRTTIQKKYSSDHSLSENISLERQAWTAGSTGFPFVFVCGSTTTYNCQIEVRKISRVIAAIALVLITVDIFLTCRNRFNGHVSWWVINWAVPLISVMSSCLEGCLFQCSPWSGTTMFWSCHTGFWPKCHHKNGKF